MIYDGNSKKKISYDKKREEKAVTDYKKILEIYIKENKPPVSNRENNGKVRK